MAKLQLGGGLRLRKPTNQPTAVTQQAEPQLGAEISETLRKFKERAKAEEQRFTDNTDSEFWICLGFQGREQKEEFLRLTGIIALGDKYLDGMEVARLLGVELTTPIPIAQRVKIDKKLLKLVRG